MLAPPCPGRARGGRGSRRRGVPWTWLVVGERRRGQARIAFQRPTHRSPATCARFHRRCDLPRLPTTLNAVCYRFFIVHRTHWSLFAIATIVLVTPRFLYPGQETATARRREDLQSRSQAGTLLRHNRGFVMKKVVTISIAVIALGSIQTPQRLAMADTKLIDSSMKLVWTDESDEDWDEMLNKRRFDEQHPECRDWRTKKDLPTYCY